MDIIIKKYADIIKKNLKVLKKYSNNYNKNNYKTTINFN